MDYKLKLKWINALESGEYEQGTGTLYDSMAHQHCCLGVLARCMGYTNEEIRIGTLRAFLQSKDKESVIDYQLENDLIHLNDTRRESFKEIAEYIKKNVPVDGECQNNSQ